MCIRDRSYNVISGFTFGGNNFNDSLDYFSTKILLPVGGLLIAVFAGWVMSKAATEDELDIKSTLGYGIWRFLIRYVVPPALLVIFVAGVMG